MRGEELGLVEQPGQQPSRLSSATPTASAGIMPTIDRTRTGTPSPPGVIRRS
jgi:hypothetical protein